MGLTEYRRKRKFNQTPEPKGKTVKNAKGPLRFVVQMHDASRMHFDFRLEMGGVFKSWAVPKGPSLNPQDQRLAVFVEDHPLDYGSFEGIIPRGNYGAGTVMVWDQGTYLERGSEGRNDSDAAMQKGLAEGHITFVLSGEKLNGEFALIQLKKDKGQKAWLLVKKRDEFSNIKRDQNFAATSVKTGRTMNEIAAQSEKSGDIWYSKRNKATPSPRRDSKTQVQGVSRMPRKLKPMIATGARAHQPGDNWIYEPHYHGLRALAEVEGKRVHMYSRSGLPYEKKFPDIAKQLSEAGLNALLDGEIAEKTYHVFDILYLDGKDLRDEPLTNRIKILHETINDSAHIKKVKPAKGKGAMIAKDPESRYQSGTTSKWLTVTRPVPDKKKAGAFHDPEQAQLTHPDKIYFPKDGYTKGDVFAYYEKAAEYMLPYLKDRPESLNRHPNGIHQAGFYQKDMTGHLPKWFKTARIFSESTDKTIDYPMVQDKRSLLYIANLGCIEIHPWFSRVEKLDRPDYLVIDLDPDDNPFTEVMKVALEFHRLLDQIGADNFVKTSGATGLHIGIPTAQKYDFDSVRAFAEKVAKVVQKKFPALTSLERTPAKRRKKIYLDCLQNRRGQTLAAPFCIRPRDGAPVSMPVMWKELTPKLKPEQFHIKNALGRASKLNDPWLGVLGQGVDLKQCLKRLDRITNKA